MDELNELPYLENVVRETLRFHPAVPKTSRVAMHDDTLPLNEPFVDADGKVQTEIRYVDIYLYNANGRMLMVLLCEES